MAILVDQMRDAAGRQLVSNEMLLRAVKQRRPPDPRGPRPTGTSTATAAKPRRRPDDRLEPVGEAALGVADGILQHAEKRFPEAAVKAAPRVMATARVAGALPGLVLDGFDIATADSEGERNRAAAGAVGGLVGGAIGGAVPLLEPITVPAGSYLGKKAGEYLYDHGPEMIANARAQADTLGDQLGRELRRYAPYDLPERLMRR